jgi:hypothetical protein
MNAFAASRRWLALTLLAIGTLAHATDEPEFKLVRQLDGAELRQYPPYVVAEVTVSGTADSAGNDAFPILAAYIFGKNKGEKKFAMQAPVTQTENGISMAMQAPVTQTASATGYRVQFVLPRGVTVESAPEPLDERVSLRQMPARQVAVIRFSGFWSETNYNEHLAQLQAILKAAGVAWTGLPEYSRYDPPFMPWFLRRNEIWLTVP